jgi:hypothetical protein
MKFRKKDKGLLRNMVAGLGFEQKLINIMEKVAARSGLQPVVLDLKSMELGSRCQRSTLTAWAHDQRVKKVSGRRFVRVGPLSNERNKHGLPSDKWGAPAASWCARASARRSRSANAHREGLIFANGVWTRRAPSASSTMPRPSA